MILPWLLFWFLAGGDRYHFWREELQRHDAGQKTMLGASRHVHAYNNQNSVPLAVINMLAKKCLDREA